MLHTLHELSGTTGEVRGNGGARRPIRSHLGGRFDEGEFRGQVGEGFNLLLIRYMLKNGYATPTRRWRASTPSM